jgi:hypothetical protein
MGIVQRTHRRHQNALLGAVSRRNTRNRLYDLHPAMMNYSTAWRELETLPTRLVDLVINIDNHAHNFALGRCRVAILHLKPTL